MQVFSDSGYVDISNTHFGMFQYVQAGYNLIDISNIKLYGYKSSNYYTLGLITISGFIDKRVITYTAKDKYYDGTYSLDIALSGTISGDILEIYDVYSSYNVGSNINTYVSLSGSYIPNILDIDISASVYYSFDRETFLDGKVRNLITGLYDTSYTSINVLDISNYVSQVGSSSLRTGIDVSPSYFTMKPFKPSIYGLSFSFWLNVDARYASGYYFRIFEFGTNNNASDLITLYGVPNTINGEPVYGLTFLPINIIYITNLFIHLSLVDR